MTVGLVVRARGNGIVVGIAEMAMPVAPERTVANGRVVMTVAGLASPLHPKCRNGRSRSGSAPAERIAMRYWPPSTRTAAPLLRSRFRAWQPCANA